MEDICSGCLVNGRNMRLLEDLAHSHIYTKILNEIYIFNVSPRSVRLCWECCWALRRVNRFREQVQRSYSQLLQNIPKLSTPRLTTEAIYNLSVPECFMKEEDSDSLHIKCERDGNTDTDVLEIDKRETSDPNVDKPKENISTWTYNTVKEEDSNIDVDRSERDGDMCASDCDDDYVPESKPKRKKEKKKDKSKKIVKRKSKSKTNAEESHLEQNPVNENIPEPPLPASIPVSRKREREHLPTKPQCVECGKMFSSKKTYRYHRNVIHRGENKHPCPRCGKVYQWKSNLGRHLRSHKAVDDGELFCEKCDKSFSSVATFKQHFKIARVHVTDSDFSFVCTECGKKFLTSVQLRDHVDWDHRHKIKFRCEPCDKSFKTHASYYIHTRNFHLRPHARDNLCHVCGKSYQNSSKLKYHITAMHSGQTPHRCSLCGAAFGWYSSLYRHVREVHHKIKLQPNKLRKSKKNDKPPAAAPFVLHQPTGTS